MADLKALVRTLGFSFADLSLLEQALVHSSYINENPAFPMASNERLEFLGDAVLGLIIAEELYRCFPRLDEGEMTRLRSSVVCQEYLFRIAMEIGLGGHLRMGRGEEASGGRSKPANLARAMEALVAAIFLDQGLDRARWFVLERIKLEAVRGVAGEVVADYKTQLQELIQSRYQKTPDYRVSEVSGPDHDRRFTVEVHFDDVLLGSGKGKSKKAAEAAAARAALKQLRTPE